MAERLCYDVMLCWFRQQLTESHNQINMTKDAFSLSLGVMEWTSGRWDERLCINNIMMVMTGNNGKI